MEGEGEQEEEEEEALLGSDSVDNSSGSGIAGDESNILVLLFLYVLQVSTLTFVCDLT